jgi:ATP-dependent Lon protease
MEMEIVLPDEVAVMTLPAVTFFPQALLPLHIFEPRYRDMLKDVLATHRLFAVAGLNPAAGGADETPHRIGTIGIIRACQKSADGTSNLLLQGLARIEFLTFLAEAPYRRVRMRALSSKAGAGDDQNLRLRRSLERLIVLKRQLGGSVPTEFSRFLRTIEDPETFVDLAAYTLCEDVPLKQRLLETLDVHQRLLLFAQHLRSEIDRLKLHRKLQGGLSDDSISLN